MAVLIVLFGSWLVFRGIGALGVGALATWQDSARYALALMFVFTGIAHFNRMKHDLVRMVPAIFRRPMLLIYLTGVLEFIGAVGLLLARFRSLAGLFLIALLIGDVPRQRERGAQGNDSGRQTGDASMAAGAYTGLVYWAFVVDHPALVSRPV